MFGFPVQRGGAVLQVRVFYHDKCFDGACSASLFTRFHRECVTADATYEYHGLVHRAGALFDVSEFTGDENAIVDFKYSASPRITWWFDHHLSAFLTPEDQQDFLAYQQSVTPPGRKFFDPNYTSCTSFIAHIGSTKFGFNTAPIAELIHWANIVDGAKYESPQSAVEMAAPAMKLTLIIEATQDAVPDAWRRHLELLLAGIRPSGTDTAHPLAERPLTEAQVRRVGTPATDQSVVKKATPHT